MGVGLPHPNVHAQPRSIVRVEHTPCTTLPSSQVPRQGLSSQARPQPPKVGVGGGVGGFVTHRQLLNTTSHVPSITYWGQAVPGVQGAGTAQRPPHGIGTQGASGAGVGVGVGGNTQAISQQTSVPFRHSHFPQQHPHVVPEGQLLTNGLHSLCVGVGVGNWVGSEQGSEQHGK